MSDTEEDVRTSFNHDFARATLLLEPILLPAENAAISIQRAVCSESICPSITLGKLPVFSLSF